MLPGLLIKQEIIMSDQMQNTVSKILNMLLTGLEKAGQVVGEELPKLLEEYVKFFIIDEIPLASIVFLLFFGWLAIWGRRLWFRLYQWHKAERVDEFGLFMCTGIGSIILGIILIGSVGDVVSSTKTIAKLYYAPKAYLIERLRGNEGKKCCEKKAD
jgi:hypothetical protein